MGAGESIPGPRRSDIYSARGAVEVALKRVDLNSLNGFGFSKDKRMELAMELTWMKTFLITSEKTGHGRKVADVWCPAIELLAGNCDDSFLKTTQRLDAACKKLASLRQKIQPFVVPTCPCDHPPPPSKPVIVKSCHCHCDHPSRSKR
ncbi:unnamed protein product [Cuscuta epithymum]|uniref:Uncharacterized protein n=1 Tax=Cuscuta epithymum TaxID=186058 RepID=A0AAV0D840_9ASTE|nr:unnamed protein product [Cuscuta epithymum]